MFDWDRFKKGEIAVHCDTEEKANNFLKKCDKKGMKWVTGDDATYDNNYYKYVKRTCYRGGRELLTFGHENYFKNKGIEIVKREVKEMKELTFKEVIANIKEGEVWENSLLKIRLLRTGYIDIENAMGWENGTGISIMADLKFTLQRKEYTFEEAFKAYEEGKEIESCEMLCKYKNGKFNLGESNPIWLELRSIPLREIRGKWYIND